MDAKEAGFWVYRLHGAFVILLIALYIIFPSLRFAIVVLYIPIFLLHAVAKHCPITRLERKLHGEDITILDPLLHLFGIPLTRKNRNGFQVVISSALLALFIAYVPR